MVAWARGFNGDLTQAAPVSPSEQPSVTHFLGLLQDPLSVASLATGEGRGPYYPSLRGGPEEGGWRLLRTQSLRSPWARSVLPSWSM